MSIGEVTECRHCSKPMLHRMAFGRPVVYCSTTCKRRYETKSRLKPPLPPRPCVVCGVEYLPPQPTAKVCGSECRKKHAATRLSVWVAERPGYYKASSAKGYDRRRQEAGHDKPKRMPRVEWLTGSCRWCGDDIKVHPTREPRVYCNVTCRREDQAYAKEIKETA